MCTKIKLAAIIYSAYAISAKTWSLEYEYHLSHVSFSKLYEILFRRGMDVYTSIALLKTWEALYLLLPTINTKSRRMLQQSDPTKTKPENKFKGSAANFLNQKVAKTTFAGCSRNVNKNPSRRWMQTTFGNIEHSD